jgi:hypothetical protein
MSINGEPGSDNLLKPSTSTSTESSVLRQENDRKTTEKKTAQIKDLFDNLPEIPLMELIPTKDNKPKMTFPLANRMEDIFRNSAFVSGVEKSQKEMLDIANRVVAQKEAGQSIKPWGAVDTETLLLQLEAREVIPPIKTLDKLTIFPKSTLRIIKNILSKPKDKSS